MSERVAMVRQPSNDWRPRAWRLAARVTAWVTVLVVLTLVFLAYHQPSLMQHLADQLWACF